MPLTEALKATRIIETLENYSVAANTAHTAVNNNLPVAGNMDNVFDDRVFWNAVFNSPEEAWNKTFNMNGCTLCHWTPRIPGLYWAPGSQALREMGSQKVIEGPGWVAYNPPTKSARVMGGMGTFLLPPDNAGFMLCTVTSTRNSSVGVPALISPEVVEAHHLQQGHCLQLRNVRWVKMSMEWAQRFPSVKGIPRGYLLINKPEAVTVTDKNIPVQFQPCTIMEYEQGGALLYDYVFMTADSTVPDYRKQAADFFEYYRTTDGRNGKYLFACDVADPLFDAVYQSPGDMRTAYDNGQLELMLQRIRNSRFNNHTIEELAGLLPRLYSTPGAIRTLSNIIELPAGLIKDDSTAKMTIELLHQSLQHKKMEELIDRVATDNPGAFN
jgi:hypothetical protein